MELSSLNCISSFEEKVDEERRMKVKTVLTGAAVIALRARSVLMASKLQRVCIHACRGSARKVDRFPYVPLPSNGLTIIRLHIIHTSTRCTTTSTGFLPLRRRENRVDRGG